MSAKVRTCRECGCTDDRACRGGCFWVEKDLCSRCFKPAVGQRVQIIYDPRPVFEGARYLARIVKATPSGMLRIETDAKDNGRPVYSELFYPVPAGRARGWNTLFWLPVTLKIEEAL
jgi:hypothetical protein